jgi:hypothetical protein
MDLAILAHDAPGAIDKNGYIGMMSIRRQLGIAERQPDTELGGFFKTAGRSLCLASRALTKRRSPLDRSCAGAGKKSLA